MPFRVQSSFGQVFVTGGDELSHFNEASTKLAVQRWAG